MVEICSSEIAGANEGLFAKVSMEVNTVIAFYNGVKARPEDFDPYSWEKNNYRIFDPANAPEGTIDIPVWAQVSKKVFQRIQNINPFQSSNAYCATLAHKTNHSFLPNAQFTVYDHPKFGLIPCIATIVDIQQGEEVS